MDQDALPVEARCDDQALPVQMSSACSARASGEHAMLHAMLLDAIQCLEGMGCPKRDRERLATQARAWVMGFDDAPFSFENVCAYLGLPADRLRRHLLRLATKAVQRDDAADLRCAELRARAARNQSIRSLRAAGLKPSDLAERFGLSYASILAICTPPLVSVPASASHTAA